MTDLINLIDPFVLAFVGAFITGTGILLLSLAGLDLKKENRSTFNFGIFLVVASLSNEK